MRKIYSIALSLLFVGQLFAGGIVTNSNQSATYVRMLSRNASGKIDAVYYNPAGLLNLNDGFHLSFHNQSIFQTKTISSTYPGLNQSEFTGDVKAPFFPNFYAVYKKDKIAVSFGFGPNGGGGSATFAEGMPMFEQMVAPLPYLMSGNGIPTTAYSAEIFFEGSSVYYGSQLNFSYKINDMISVAGGVRMINAKNAYEGYLRSIMVNPTYPPIADGSMVSAPAFFGQVAGLANGVAASLQTPIDNGAGGFTLDQLVGAGQMDQAQADMLAGGLGAGYDPAMTLSQVQGAYYYSGAVANGYAAQTGDIEVDATQSGLAFTPILSVNISPLKNLDIAIKYEFNTKLELKNDTKIDGSGMFPHDSTSRADIPAILAIGVKYGFTDAFRAHLSYNTYFDKQADWDGKEDKVDNNLWELAIGLEYDVIEKLTLSAGYSMGKTGVSDEYQSDLSYSNSSSTIGLGAEFRVSDKLALTLAGMTTIYKDYSVDMVGPPAYTKVYGKSTSGFAVGIDYRF